MKKYLNLSLACLLIFGFLATQAYDGEMVWIINPQTGASEEMPDDQAGYFKRDTYGFGALLSPEKLGISYAYKGKEKIEDTEYLVMEQTIMSDYRAVDGVMTAHYFQSIPYLLTTGIPCSSSQTME